MGTPAWCPGLGLGLGGSAPFGQNPCVLFCLSQPLLSLALISTICLVPLATEFATTGHTLVITTPQLTAASLCPPIMVGPPPTEAAVT